MGIASRKKWERRKARFVGNEANRIRLLKTIRKQAKLLRSEYVR